MNFIFANRSAAKKRCHASVCPILIATGVVLSVSTLMSVLIGELTFLRYARTAQPALESAANSDRVSPAQRQLAIAIAWFEENDWQMSSPPQAQTAIKRLEQIESGLGQRSSTALTIVEQSAIQLVFEAIDAEYRRNSALHVAQRLWPYLLISAVAATGGGYATLLLLRRSIESNRQP